MSSCWRARSTASPGCRSTRNAATRRRRRTRSRFATCAGSIRRFQPDVVHAHNWLVHSYLPLERRAGAAFVLSLHDYSLVCATKRFFYKGGVCSGPAAGKCLAHSVDFYGAAKGTVVAAGVRAAEPWLRRRVDMFLPVSEAVSRLSGLDERVAHRVVPNFIGELPAPPPADDPRLAALPDEPFILYFGDVAEDKGVGRLVEAYAGLEGAPPLVLIGRQLIDGVEDVPGVVALDPLPHPLVIEALRRSLFSVAPSLLPESFGIVALEAAAAGKPAIVSDIGGLSDIVVDGETGLLVAPGDVEGAAGRAAPALRGRRAAGADGGGGAGAGPALQRRGDRAVLRGCIRSCRGGPA